MGALLFVVACVTAIGPAIAAAAFGIGVPPQQGILFGATALTLSAVASLLAFQQRYRIWRASAAAVTRQLLVIGTCVGLSLILYLVAYNWCVVEHPLYEGKSLFPLWTSGRLAGMIGNAGSRYGAVETYGPAAVFDALSEQPGSYAITIGVLLLLHGPALAATSGLVVLLALRQPLWRASTAATTSACDVFVCYNRADVLAVRAIVKELTTRGMRCFFDERENPPGQAWTAYVERAIDASRSFAIALGPNGIGQWQAIEIQNIVEARLRRGVSVIPLLLPDTPHDFRLPMQLAGLTWVDFRRTDPEPLTELVRGISLVTGAGS